MGPQAKVEGQISVLPVARAPNVKMTSGELDDGPYAQNMDPRQLIPRAVIEGMRGKRRHRKGVTRFTIVLELINLIIQTVYVMKATMKERRKRTENGKKYCGEHLQD